MFNTATGFWVRTINNLKVEFWTLFGLGTLCSRSPAQRTISLDAYAVFLCNISEINTKTGKARIRKAKETGMIWNAETTRKTSGSSHC